MSDGPYLMLIAIALLGMASFGAGLWLRTGDAAERSRRARALGRCALWTVLVLALSSAAMFGLYVVAYERTNAACRRALTADTLAERQARVVEAKAGWRWLETLLRTPLLNSCIDSAGELERLEREGTCPSLVPPERPCTCAGMPWPADLGCQGPVTCRWEGEFPNRAQRLRCLPQDEYERFGL
jgi:hypothetical protein